MSLERTRALVLEIHRVDGSDLVEVLDVVTHVVTRGIEPCRWASATVFDGETPGTVAQRGDVAIAVDEAQYRSRSGPCVDAARTGRTVDVPDTETVTGWDEFAVAARRNGVGSALGVPFRIEQMPGSINLYAATRDAFGAEERAAAELIAENLSVAGRNVVHQAAAELVSAQLREALRSRDVIGQAKGILMSALKVDEDEAFALLQRASQRRNVKLRSVAAEVARTGALDE